jgi:hypothetical protein
MVIHGVAWACFVLAAHLVAANTSWRAVPVAIYAVASSLLCVAIKRWSPWHSGQSARAVSMSTPHYFMGAARATMMLFFSVLLPSTYAAVPLAVFVGYTALFAFQRAGERPDRVLHGLSMLLCMMGPLIAVWLLPLGVAGNLGFFLVEVSVVVSGLITHVKMENPTVTPWSVHSTMYFFTAVVLCGVAFYEGVALDVSVQVAEESLSDWGIWLVGGAAALAYAVAENSVHSYRSEPSIKGATAMGAVVVAATAADIVQERVSYVLGILVGVVLLIAVICGMLNRRNRLPEGGGGAWHFQSVNPHAQQQLRELPVFGPRDGVPLVDFRLSSEQETGGHLELAAEEEEEEEDDEFAEEKAIQV